MYKGLKSQSFKGSLYFNRTFLRNKKFSRHIGATLKMMLHIPFQNNGDGIFSVGAVLEAPQSTLWSGKWQPLYLLERPVIVKKWGELKEGENFV